jgi:small subunit ribosomal protein S17
MSTKTNTIKKSGHSLKGEVVSTSMKDTVVVKVNRFVKHEKYNKYYTISKKYKAHDAGNTAKVGDKVEIFPCAPVSKDKRYSLVK